MSVLLFGTEGGSLCGFVLFFITSSDFSILIKSNHISGENTYHAISSSLSIFFFLSTVFCVLSFLLEDFSHFNFGVVPLLSSAHVSFFACFAISCLLLLASDGFLLDKKLLLSLKLINKMITKSIIT